MTKKIDPEIANYIDQNKTTKSFGSIISNLANDDSILKRDTPSHLKSQELPSIVQKLKESHISEKDSNNNSLPSRVQKAFSIKFP